MCMCRAKIHLPDNDLVGIEICSRNLSEKSLLWFCVIKHFTVDCYMKCGLSIHQYSGNAW